MIIISYPLSHVSSLTSTAQVCIGKRFAEEESMLLLASLIINFDITLAAIGGLPQPEGSPVELCDIPTVSNVTLSFEKRMSLRFVPVVI